MARISPMMVAPPLIFLGLASVFLIGLIREDPNALPTARIGQVAPPIDLAQLGDRAPFTDETLRQGGVKLVNYWASWCVPCRSEHRFLQRLRDEGVPIYGVNYKDKPENALAFLAELGDPYAGIGADATGRNFVDWGVFGVPETFVIAADGTVMLRFAGPINESILTSTIRPAMEDAAVR